jgi:hypothetical protein
MMMKDIKKKRKRKKILKKKLNNIKYIKKEFSSYYLR